MEFIFEILFELIVEGSLEAAGDKKVPLLFRILAAAVLILVFGGLVVFLVWTGIADKNWILAAAGVLLAVFFGFAVRKVFQKHQHRGS